MTTVPFSGLHRFGPFTFREVSTLKKGIDIWEHKWVVRCPWHTDAGNPGGTFCQKSRVWDAPQEKERHRLHLRDWCLGGRVKAARAHPVAASHKWMTGFDKGRTATEQDEEMAKTLTEVSWIVAEDDGQHDTGEVVVSAASCQTRLWW